MLDLDMVAGVSASFNTLFLYVPENTGPDGDVGDQYHDAFEYILDSG